MTQYVELQKEVVRVLNVFKGEDPNLLKSTILLCQRGGLKPSALLKILKRFHFNFCSNVWDWKKEIVEIFLGQIDNTDSEPVVKNLLGMKLYGYGNTLSLEEYAKRKGSGENHLRTDRLAQPAALVAGDILADGSRVLSEPREGGNGAVLIHLTGGFGGAWISVPSRIPIALLTESDKVPENYVD